MNFEQNLLSTLLQHNINWRFPDVNGLSERTLDCKQLAVMEILRWKGIDQIIPIFMNPFNCVLEGITLKRKEPKLQMGWVVNEMNLDSENDIKEKVQSVFDNNGYCILYYKAFKMPLSSYYNIHDITHWSLITKSTNEELVIFDNTGTGEYFKGLIGTVPWDTFLEYWKEAGEGIATVINPSQDFSEKEWNKIFLEIVEESIKEMIEHNGLSNLFNFIKEIEKLPTTSVIRELEKFEFSFNNFRRIRELWLLAVERKFIPKQYIMSGWVEELMDLCKAWTLVIGLILKWKRQQHKDYKEKLCDFLWEVYENEKRFFDELSALVRSEGFDS
ncbi:hypothetical protein [Cytobacillus pseudoceanisediminis]|uniref:hypothetical protein n=1 Tax=Cytobacillus pseudoceanisediminis TaxID=3051614 RepID=UPI003C2B31E7